MKNLPQLPVQLIVIQSVNLGGMAENAFHVQDPDANVIWATCKGDRRTLQKEVERRAYLLAAAPKLLNALICMVDFVEGKTALLPSEIKAARAAIEEANVPEF
jgi:hypothetical protein